MTKINKNEVKELFEKGKTKKEIADFLGVGKSTISMALKEFGLTKDMNDIKVNEEQFRNLHNLGLTTKQISIEMGISKSIAHELIKKLELKPNILSKDERKELTDKKKVFNPSKEELKLLKETMTYKEIAKKFNTTSVTIWKRLKENNLI